MFPAILFLIAAFPLKGQTNALPPLLPPYGELPPTFWEQHATLVVATGLGIIAAIAFGLWLAFRPKPKVIIPPEVQARQALELLRQQPEDGVVLSRVSQVVRNYFIAAFQLAPGEHTTTEFHRALSGHEQIGAELSTAAAGFLRGCDDRKFSTATSLVPLDAVNQALGLVALAEQRRAQLRQLAETQTQGRCA
ncbi:MAG: hypothetical protein PHY43_15405 [Verrucomicrobiales bacterium]|nr:hypothetical protein [Verrucomicrobiales bacterium]